MSAAACGGSSGSGAGKSHGNGAEAGQGNDALGVGGSAARSSGINVTSGGTTGSGGDAASGASGAADASGGTISVGGETSAGGSVATGGTDATGGSAGTVAMGTTQCNDGIDNDGDGLIDGLDPECTGPWDNDESSFATGIPGDNKDPKWQDCFFDGNSGAGDDGCRYGTDCLLGATPQEDPTCTVSQQCIDNCAPSVPNGCDCFGCCTVQEPDGSTVDIFLASTCSMAKIDDATACPRCTKNTQCQNTCGECELCPGKTAADLPASCTPAPTGTGGTSGSGGSGGGSSSGGTDGNPPPPPPSYTCDGSEQVCGPGLAACPSGLYCSLGCCLVVVR
jgi:hypothetical protein